MPPPRKLSRAQILDAAIELLDDEGLPALSMRRLGERLGVEAMSLYGYVRNKADLLAGVHDTLLGQMQPDLGSDDSVANIRRLARSFREVLRAHPNALPMFATRPATGPNALRQVERGLAVLDAMGLSPADALATFQVMFAFVVGHALYTFRPPDDEDLDYAELPPDFPHLRRLASVLPHRDLDMEFELGLDTFIAGLRSRA